MTLYQEHVLNAPDVCNNCFALVRIERERTTSATQRSDVSVEKTPYTRVDTTTSVEYTPAETASDSKTVFCECGVESSYHRIWQDDDRCPTMPRFKHYLKTLMRTLDEKGVTLNRETCAGIAIQHYRDENDINQAFSSAVKTAVQTAAANQPRAKASSLSD